MVLVKIVLIIFFLFQSRIYTAFFVGYGELMKEITRQMIRIYGLKEFDFMGYKLIKNNATFHHLIKKENGGRETIDNGAVLMPVSHSYLHLIEFKNFDIYYSINSIMKICNKKGCINKEDLLVISELLHMFEDEHKNDLTSKRKRLIKNEFKDRLYY